MSHFVDFCRKVLGIREKENLSIREIAKRFHISSASVTRWLSRRLSRIEVKPSSPRQRKLDKVG